MIPKPTVCIQLTGNQLGVCMMSTTWVSSCPFDVTRKPAYLESVEVELITERFIEIIDGLRAHGFQEPMDEYKEPIPVEFTVREWELTISSIEAVLRECENDPLELSLRVGELEDVKRTLALLESAF
jgi:hypothetical protein